MILTVCPSREQLVAYTLGKLAEQELEALAEHVEHCSTCQGTLQGLASPEDTIVAGLREAGATDPEPSDPAYRAAVAKLEAMADGGLPPTIGAGIALGSDSLSDPSPDRSTDQPPLGQLREYRLLEKLGSGGMGTVYKALHTRLDKLVALKVLPADRMRDPRAVARFQREMKAVGHLDHPNIVRATDAGEVEGTHFLVMEYVEGIDLARLVKRIGSLPVADACELVRQVALGLQHAHEHGLVHRDIKPSNLLLTSDGQVKVLDLGLALLRRTPTVEQGLTASGETMGTPDYMAPEQVRDTHVVDIRADIYSLGCTLYTLLIGHAPFSGPQFTFPVQTMMAHVELPVAPIRELRPDVPVPLAAVLQKMLAKKPAERFATPAEVASALERFTAGSNLSALVSPEKPLTGTKPSADWLIEPASERTTAGGKPAGALKRPRRWLPLAAAAVLLAAAGLYFAPQVVRIVTNKGQIMIETDGVGIEVVIKDGLGKVLVDGETKREITFQAGEYNIEVTVKDSGGEQRFVTDNFTLTRGGKQIVKARWEVAKAKPVEPRPSETAPADPDRRAAEWVLSIGGTISIKENGKERQTGAVGDLPRGAFELTFVNLDNNQKVSDAALAHFKDCKNLTTLVLGSTPVSDAGLAHFKDCKNLIVWAVPR